MRMAKFYEIHFSKAYMIIEDELEMTKFRSCAYAKRLMAYKSSCKTDIPNGK